MMSKRRYPSANVERSGREVSRRVENVWIQDAERTAAAHEMQNKRIGFVVIGGFLKRILGREGEGI